MTQLAVIGRNEFNLGFTLSGVRNTFECDDKNFRESLANIKKQDVGVVILDESLLSTLDEFDRKEIEDSVSPIFVPVSNKESNDDLRRLIKKSVGVDLWQK